MEKTVELLKALVRAITSEEEVKVIETISDDKMDLVVIVSEENMPRVIGRNRKSCTKYQKLSKMFKRYKQTPIHSF